MESYQKSLLAALSEALFEQKTEYVLQDESYNEAMQQAVLLLLMSVAPNSSYQKENGAILANSIRSFYDHGELHEIMTEAYIPYVVLKGAVSASYYPNPVDRSMGDIDFTLRDEGREIAASILEEQGFACAAKSFYEWQYFKKKHEIELQNALVYERISINRS